MAQEKGHDSLGKEMRGRMDAVEGEIGALKRIEAQGTGAGDAGAGPSRSESGASGRGQEPSSRPGVRWACPDLVTRAPAEDDEEVFGDAWPMIVEWPDLQDAHPTRGRSLSWLTNEERLLVLELEEHGLTLPPEKQPLRDFRRKGQTTHR